MEKLYLEFPSMKRGKAAVAVAEKNKIWNYALPTLILSATVAYAAFNAYTLIRGGDEFQ